MSIRFRALVITSASILAIATAACSKSKDGTGTAAVTSANAPKGGSCFQEKAGVCTEYKENPLGIAEGACKDMFKGTYSKNGCPTADLMGTCQMKDDKKFYYFGNGVAPWVSDATDDCEKNPLAEGGKFTAQAGAEESAKAKALPAASKIGGSCTNESGTCEDLYGSLVDLQKSTCEQFGGKYATTACPAENLVASCVKNGKVERRYVADLKTMKMEELRENCEKFAIPFGHFYPGPNAPAAAPAKAAAKGGATAGGAKAKK